MTTTILYPIHSWLFDARITEKANVSNLEIFLELFECRGGGGGGGGALIDIGCTWMCHPTGFRSFRVRTLELGIIFGFGLQDWVSFSLETLNMNFKYRFSGFHSILTFLRSKFVISIIVLGKSV